MQLDYSRESTRFSTENDFEDTFFTNNDGIRQASEPGAPGVTVFLNSVYPVVTDSRGEYSFPSVGLGSHFLFIDESALPLPWTLTDGEYTPLTVELRRSVQLNIAVSPITLAEAD